MRAITSSDYAGRGGHDVPGAANIDGMIAVVEALLSALAQGGAERHPCVVLK
jgi:hypothetical protein